ncbi:hypothetical protein P5673_013868 [Acropora cervicornis]|uniref:Uncharacterized protein n=1 Tax=Acropora cervicornis TaxID=6130 RepID=A0AAD9QKL0_ACRCE|nr:hypothetical protein P5673_013868 [Acropora cervicornis]
MSWLELCSFLLMPSRCDNMTYTVTKDRMKSKLVIQPTNASSDCCGRHDKDGKQDEHQLTNPKDENLSL